SEKLIWLMGGSDQVVRRFSHNRDLFGDSLEKAYLVYVRLGLDGKAISHILYLFADFLSCYRALHH
ncbi:hypothetical protein, partial [Pseudomonas savastanoi]